MLKPILNFKELQNQEEIESLSKETGNLSSKNSKLVLRKKRSSEYVEIIKSFDISGHHITKEKVDEIINAIKNELPELTLDEMPIGIVAKCYLGEPFEVHSLTLFGHTIIEHYKKGQSMPADLERARTLANNTKYAFVEVYKTKLVAVKEDGSSSVVDIGETK